METNRNRKLILEYIRERVKEDIVVKIVEKLLDDLYQAKQNFLMGINKFQTASGLIYMAYRKAKMPKTLFFVAKMCGTRGRNVGREFLRLKEILGMKYCKSASIISKNCILPVASADVIRDVGKRLGLSEEEISLAERMNKKYDFGCSPSVRAGAFIYYALLSGEKWKSQVEISDCLGISEISLRKGYHLILGKIGQTYNPKRKTEFVAWHKEREEKGLSSSRTTFFRLRRERKEKVI